MTRTQLGRPVGASGEETRRRIIVATMRCVAEVGYARATIREIARAADMTSASLYNYFPAKAVLIRAAIATRNDAAMPRLRAAARGPGHIVDRIEAVLDESGLLLREYPHLAAFEWAIRAENLVTEAGGDAAEPRFESIREIIDGIVADACREGELCDDLDPRATAEAIYGLIYGLTELAATLPGADFQAALQASKSLVRGTLFNDVP